MYVAVVKRTREIYAHAILRGAGTGSRGRECAAHYGIMGYFDPSRITESTMRDSIRRKPERADLFASALWRRRDGRKDEKLKKDETRKLSKYIERGWERGDEGGVGRVKGQKGTRGVSIGRGWQRNTKPVKFRPRGV